MEEFGDVTPEELTTELPPMREIQQQIDLGLGARIPKLPHYRMTPVEHQILRGQGDELLQ